VADRALAHEAPLPPQADTPRPWLTRLPATGREAHAARTTADPAPLEPRMEGDRDPLLEASAGTMAQRGARRDARVAQPRGCQLATHALDASAVAPQARLAGDTGPKQAARGGRGRTAPLWLASSLDRNPPPRIMARWRVMTMCVWGYAA